MRFVWFWTFWHWSKEGFRAGALLRDPLQGVGGHWDEWFRHEASEEDRQAIERAGGSEAAQRRFIAWLVRHWAREAESCGNRLISRFVLGQLAHLPPFKQWPAFERFRAGYGIGGISSVVLAEASIGEAGDVRPVEAVLLPSNTDVAESKVLPEGFHADGAELNAAREAAMSLLRGKGLMVFLALWIASGRRPYPRWLKICLGLGWLLVGGLIGYLLVGPDPDEGLFLFSAVLVTVWSGLMLTSAAVAGGQIVRAWRQGQIWSNRLERSQLRLRMNGGLTLKGGSAGLAFCLNTLLALYRAYPREARRSWLWRRFLRKLNSEASAWAATGVVTSAARVKPVIIESKLRACLQQVGIRHILTPHQRDVGRQAISRLTNSMPSIGRQNTPPAGYAKLGFATEHRLLRSHPCRHVAQSLMAIGGFTSKWQVTMNVLAVGLSATMLSALPDLLSILLPPPAPAAVPPSSPSPRYLWISLDTNYPRYFQVVLESDFWANRRVGVSRYSGANASVRAEIHLRRLARPTRDQDDATIWVERRLWFLNREYAPGERVGCYSLPYLTSLGHE